MPSQSLLRLVRNTIGGFVNAPFRLPISFFGRMAGGFPALRDGVSGVSARLRRGMPSVLHILSRRLGRQGSA